MALSSLALLLVVSGVGGPEDGRDVSTGPAGQGGASTTPATPGPAPLLLSATGDASPGRVTLHFNRPVVEGDPGPPAAMSLVVYGDSPKGCSTAPQGRAREYLSGIGTDTITTDASGLVGGTDYITVGDGFVRSAADGTPYQSTGCIHINVTNAGPASPVTDGPAGAPELLSATGDRVAGRITLRFSHPVVAGDGPGAYDPSDPPPGNTRLAPMQLVFHVADSTCRSPAGNARQFLSGLGTDTVTLDAGTLVVGATYISILPGFVKGAAGEGAPATAVPCVAVMVTG